MNREEREQYVIQLYKEGKTTREIAKLMRMSVRDIGAAIKKVKLQADRESGYTVEEPQPKSPESKAFKLFSEGKTPVEVVIALDLPAQVVETIYHEYWECKRMFELVEIYQEAKYDLHELLRLYRIIKRLGMKEQDIINVLELAKHNQLELLQGKVEYLTKEIKMLEWKKTNATNYMLELNKIIDEFEGRLSMCTPWLQNRGEMAYNNKGTEWYNNNTNHLYPIPYSWYDNTGNLHPAPYPKPYTDSYSLQLSYNSDYYWP
jgi:transposase